MSVARLRPLQLGFTLVELIIVIAILGPLLTLIPTLLLTRKYLKV